MKDGIILGELWDLVRNCQSKFTRAKVVISAVLKQRGANKASLSDLNRGVEWMCRKSGAGYLDANPLISSEHLSAGGLHLTKSGAAVFGNILKNCMTASAGRTAT